MESPITEFAGLAYGVDLILKDPNNRVIVCGEVKKDEAEFKKMVDGFRYCCQSPPHAREECKFGKTNHAKYEFCEVVKPDYFFITAPNHKICFKINSAASTNIEDVSEELPSLKWFS